MIKMACVFMFTTSTVTIFTGFAPRWLALGYILSLLLLCFSYYLSWSFWPAPGSEDTELGVLMEPEVGYGETEVYTGVQA